jgi:hypothetical protein
LSIRIYRDEREDRYRSLLDLIPFKVVTPSLQPGVVVSYQVWGVWFPPPFAARGNRSYLVLWVVVVPGVQDPDRFAKGTPRPTMAITSHSTLSASATRKHACSTLFFTCEPGEHSGHSPATPVPRAPVNPGVGTALLGAVHP